VFQKKMPSSTFLKNQNQVYSDARAAKPVFAHEFVQQHQGQNQNAAIVVQSAQLAKRAMHQRVVVVQSRQPDLTDHVVSHEKPQIPSEPHGQKAPQ
jgi:galactitol-specific phosphotransferase system IIB component